MIPSWKLIAGKEREPNLFLSNVYLQFMHRRWLPRILIAVGVITSYYWMIFIYLWESALIVEKISRVSWPFLAKVVLITILDSLKTYVCHLLKIRGKCHFWTKSRIAAMRFGESMAAKLFFSNMAMLGTIRSEVILLSNNFLRKEGQKSIENELF